MGNNRNICQGQTIVLNPGNFDTYLWQDLSTAQQYSVTKPGTYQVTVTNAFSCKASARIIIPGIAKLPTGFLPKDQELCIGNVLKINLQVDKAGTYNLLMTDATGKIVQDKKMVLTKGLHDIECRW